MESKRTYKREGRMIWLGSMNRVLEFGHEFDTEADAIEAEQALAQNPLYRLAPEAARGVVN